MFDPKKLGEEADKMIAELNQSKGTETAPPEDQPADSEAIAQEVVNKTPDDQGVPTADIEVSAKDVPAAQGDLQAELDRLRKQADSAEQKWKVLQGMINKKDEEIDALRTLFAQLNTSTEPQASAASTAQELVTDDDIAEYGRDHVDMVKRVAKSVAMAEISALRGELEAKLGKLEGTMHTVEQNTAKTAQDLFFDALTKLSPDWRTLNTDAGFLSWLQEEDVFAGTPRHQLLQYAVANGDANRAAVFFNTYKPPVAPPTEELVDQPVAKGKVEKFIAPGKAKAATPKQDSANKRVWSRADIAKLYSDKMAGRITAKEADELERDIFAAQQEGRIAA